MMMKKISIFKKNSLGLAFLLLATFPVFAQLPTLDFGLKAGVNLAKLKTDLADEQNRLGYQVGVYSRIGGLGVYLQPELYLGSKGSKFTAVTQENGTEVKQDGKVNFTTLDLPILIGTRVGVSALAVRFMAGPVVSFVVDKEKPVATAYSNITDFGNYKNNAWGLQAGAGVDVASLTFDVRYEAGVSNLSKSAKYDQKTNLWHISLGYKIF